MSTASETTAQTAPQPAPAAPGSAKCSCFRCALPWLFLLLGVLLGAVLYSFLLQAGAPAVLFGATTIARAQTVLMFFGRIFSVLGGATWWLTTLILTLLFVGALFFACLVFSLWTFKKPSRGCLWAFFLFLYGITLYGGRAFLKPEGLRDSGFVGTLAGSIARFDNAFSVFFPSRGSYDEIDLPSPARSPSHLLLSSPHALFILPSLPPHPSSPAALSAFLPLLYYLFHLLCYAFSIALAATFFSRRLVNAALMLARAAWYRFLSRRPKPLRIFWGEGREAYTAATEGPEGFFNAFIVPNKVPLALRHRSDPVTDRLNTESDLLWTYASPNEPTWPMSWLFSQAQDHFFLGEDGRKNLIHANQLLDFLGKHPQKNRPAPTLYVRIDADSEDDPLFAWADNWNKNAAKTSGGATAANVWLPSIRVVREPTLVASDLLWKHPMHDAPGISRSPDGTPSGHINLLLVGFGAHGKVLLRDLIQDARFPGVPLRVTVVDKDPNAFTFLKTAARAALGEFDISCEPVDALSEDFWTRFIPDPDATPAPDARPPLLWNRIVLAMENDLDNIRLALRIERHYRQHGLFGKLAPQAVRPEGKDVVFARVRRIRNNQYLEALGDSSFPATCFGSLKDIYGSASFPGVPSENAAKFLNWTYCHQNDKAKDISRLPSDRLPPEADPDWLATSSFDRESSRASVFGFRNLLWLLGFSNPDREGPAPLAPDAVRLALARLAPSALERLAETEHLRWNAFHLLRGVRPWPREQYLPLLDGLNQNDPDARAKSGVRPNQRIARNLHAAIAPYADLPLIAADFDEANNRAFPGKATPVAIDTADKTLISKMPAILALARWSFPGQKT